MRHLLQGRLEEIQNPSVWARLQIIWTEKTNSLSHFPFKVLGNRFEIAFCCEPALLIPNQKREVFCHLAAFDGVNDSLLEACCKFDEFLIVIELAAMGEASRPSKDRRR